MDLPFLLYNSELYYSALTLTDYILEENEITDNMVILYRIVILKSLFNLKLYHRALKYINKNENLLDYECVRTIFLKLNNFVEKQGLNMDTLDQKNCLTVEMPEMKLNRKSIEKLLEGMIQTGHIRKYSLIEAFENDFRNFEPLLVLKRESLITDEELNNLLDKCDRETQVLFVSVLKYDKKCLIAPFFSENVALKLYNKYNIDNLVYLGMEHLDRYPEESTSFFIYGLANILQKKYFDAKILFYDAIKKERSFGILWILLGLSYSNLREYNCAISSFEFAKQLMVGSYKPDYFLALEYHKMSNMKQANIFYLNSLRIKKEPRVILKYCALLIHFEYYDEALKLLKSLKIDGDLQNIYFLLFTFGLLFTGELQHAKSLLEKAEKDWRYFAIKGYLAHLQSDTNSATKYYTDALIEKGRSWIIEDLIKNAIDCKKTKDGNLVYDYGTSLFEFIDLKSADVLPNEL
ncbi:Anaphase-promoting complex (APC), Cdc16 subunit [Pseudoloma neurophilia]|uniref:Anaphase-promoting complex (APC), Cdc16 subunit n=1 Tax=Pseudoloma neurophilia TaxID=146866 RepID=A0A0R0M6I9_9MICR|nr:Anaphase-promoting complex (APC), Cdc16 subunit [Pseudoloma neurophilia]